MELPAAEKGNTHSQLATEKVQGAASPRLRGDDTPREAVAWKPNKAHWLVFGCLALLSFVISLDTTVITPALPVLQSSLGGTTVQAFWAGTSYLLASAACQPFIVDISDVLGRRVVLAVTVSLFTLGTILCAVSHGFGLFLVGRSMQGVGGGGIMAGCIVIVTDIVPLRQRPTYYSIVQMAWAVGTTVGPVVGGAITQNISWRWIFYINLPFCGIGLVLVPFTIRIKAERPSILTSLASIDWIGGFLFISTLCSFLIGITWGGNQFPWSSWRTITPIIVGAVGLAAALVWERFAAQRPFIHLGLFTNYSAMLAYICACLQGALMLGLLYFIPLSLQTVKGFDAIGSGLALMVILGILLPSSVITGILLTRLGYFRWAIWAGWTITTTAIGLLTLVNQGAAASRWVCIFLTLGIGHGLVLTSLNFAVQAFANDNKDASAAGMYTFMRSLGMCIGVAVAGSFFQNRLSVQLRDRDLPAKAATEAAGFALELRTGELDQATKDLYIRSFEAAFRELWIFFAAVSALALVLSSLIQHSSLDRELISDHIIEGDTTQDGDKKQSKGADTV